LPSVGTPGLWTGFSLFVLAFLFVDLLVLNRRAHSPGMREALTWVLLCIGAAAAFNALLWVRFGHDVALQFTTGYVVEEALSVDNLFVFLVLFRSLGVPPIYQHRVLFWGILGAVVMRGLFVFVGTALITRFDWILYVFGAFLVLTGVKLLFQSEVEPHPERNPLVRFVTHFVPTTAGYREGRFVVKEHGRRFATPLLVALVAAEATDVVFATDSIPAIFAITRDPFIVFTSNIFAILGLRALYFVLAGLLDRFHYLKLGLAGVLIFVGGKMLVEPWLHVPIAISLGVILGVLVLAVVASVLRPARPDA
jgi:tellurite resistance protein TerC